MVETIEARLTPEKYSADHIREWISQKLHISPKRISGWEIIRRSIDARKTPVKYVLRLKVWIDESPSPEPIPPPILQNVSTSPELHIIGMGPCGLFAALCAVEQGYKPIIWERGKNVRDRRRDLAQLTREGVLNPESNYCYGEGGAGTFSDGKLYTRSTKRGNIRKILELLVHYGAPRDILVDAHPHIGTNKLPKIIQAIRQSLLECGAEIHFSHKLTDFEVSQGKIKALVFNDTLRIACSQVLLATGHSARDIFELLHQKGITLEAKALAIGVRIEHPQALIDRIQYHCTGPRPPQLPPSSYQWVRQAQQRGVHSFCMCPGGIICPATTHPGEVVVNGWSPSKRSGKFANSGIVVQASPEDIPEFGEHPLQLMYWQQALEQKAYTSGGGNFIAPAQRLTDFLAGKASASLPECSYRPGIQPRPTGRSFTGLCKPSATKRISSNRKTNEGVYYRRSCTGRRRNPNFFPLCAFLANTQACSTPR